MARECYIEAQSLINQGTHKEALIMALMMTKEGKTLRNIYPDVYDEFNQRKVAEGGLLPHERTKYRTIESEQLTRYEEGLRKIVHLMGGWCGEDACDHLGCHDSRAAFHVANSVLMGLKVSDPELDGVIAADV